MKPSILLALAAFTLPAPAAVIISGATGNGNFETYLNGATGKINFSTGNVANWTNWTERDTTATDTGVETIGADRAAYIQPGGAIRSLLTEVGTVGTAFTYGFSFEGGSGNATMVLLYQDPINGFTEIAGTVLRSGSAAGGTVGTYSNTFTITAGSAWENQQITVGFRPSIASDGGAAPTGQYPNIDNVTFSSAPVPEPSAALLGGLGALALLRRRRNG